MRHTKKERKFKVGELVLIEVLNTYTVAEIVGDITSDNWCYIVPFYGNSNMTERSMAPFKGMIKVPLTAKLCKNIDEFKGRYPEYFV